MQNEPTPAIVPDDDIEEEIRLRALAVGLAIPEEIELMWDPSGIEWFEDPRDYTQ